MQTITKVNYGRGRRLLSQFWLCGPGVKTKSEQYLHDCKTNSKENAEILVLEAQWYTVWIAFDGQQYGMKYSGKVQQLYQEALQLAPNNPRVILSKAEWDIGSATYFNQSVEPYCKDIQRAIDLFATFKSETPFYPTWGKERAEEVLKSCGK